MSFQLGKPKPMIISKIEREDFKREVERWMETEKRIFLARLERAEGIG